MVGTVTVAEWAAEWLVRCPRPAESTNVHNAAQVRSFARAFGKRSLGSVTRLDAQRFARDHASCVREVRAMFADAVSLGLLDVSPFAGVRVARRRGRERIAALEPAELESLVRLAAELRGPVFAAMVAAAAWTGLRPGELFLLSRERGDRANYVDFDAGLVHVDWQLNARTGWVERPKYGSIRSVVLLPGAVAAFESVAQAPGKPLFLTRRGQSFNARSHYGYWDPVRTAFTLGLPAGHHLRQRAVKDPRGNLDFYELRHFFGTTLAQPPEGVRAASPYEIASMMGNSVEVAMRTYTHVRSRAASDAIRDAWAVAS